MNKTIEITCSMNRTVELTKAWIKIVIKSQDPVVTIAAFFAPVEKIKENLIPFYIFCIILIHDKATNCRSILHIYKQRLFKLS